MRVFIVAGFITLLSTIAGSARAAGLTIHNESGRRACVATSSGESLQTQGWFRIEPGTSLKITGIKHVYAMDCDSSTRQWVLPERMMAELLCVNLTTNFQYSNPGDMTACKEAGGSGRIFYESLDLPDYHWTLN
jgi:hypothetical protein